MNYGNLSDELLAEKARGEDDSDAQRVLLDRYENLIHSVVKPYFIKGAEKEDLVQEGRLGLYKAVKTFNGASSFKTYAYTCVKSSVLSAVRRSGAQKRAADAGAISLAGITEVGDEEKNPIISDSDSNPETKYINKESAKELSNRIMFSLSDSERKILLMRLDGYSYKEISDLTGKNLKSVDNTVQRIRKKLACEKKRK